MKLHPLTRRDLALLAPFGALLLLVLARPVQAADPAGAELTGGCRIQATSTDAAGKQLHQVTGPGSASADNPFRVDPKGSITWSGEAPLIRSGSYSVGVKIDLLVSSITVPVQGGTFTNTDLETSASGTFDLSGVGGLVVGTWPVAGSISGDGGACSGSGWVRIEGSSIASPLGFAGIGGFGLGLLGILGSVRGVHPWRGLGAGLVTGLGLAILSLVLGLLPLGAFTPVASLLAGTVAGGAVGLVRGGGPAGAARLAGMPR